MKSDQFATVYAAAVHRLKSLQEKNGGFASDTSLEEEPFLPQKVRHTTFFTAIILECLNQLPENSAIKQVQERAAQFLLNERTKQWLWNYWSKEGIQNELHAYPDDLDDTFLALSALQGYRAELVGAEALAATTKNLIATEVKAGGPYRTWVVSASAAASWRDTDVAVNANIAYFLGSQNVQLPGLRSFLDEAVTSSIYVSRYYPSPLVVLYYLSRCILQQEMYKQLAEEVLAYQFPGKHWGNPLLTALAVSALCRCGIGAASLKEAREYLLKTYALKEWKVAAFCLDPAEEGSVRYAGSEAATVALCLEALSLCEEAPLSSQSPMIKVREEILKKVNARVQSLDPTMQEVILKMGDKIASLDTQIPILTLPHRVELALGITMPSKKLTSLGMANLYGWIAYSIFDDFLDGEGNPQALPAATWALREMRYFFTTVVPGAPFQDYVQQVLDTLDSANAWEQREARFIGAELPEKLPQYDSYEQLAARSFGHALPALGVLAMNGFTPNSKEGKATATFFHHFLIARQLNDDAHDWEADLAAGQLTAVVTMLLEDYGEKEVLDVSELKKLFWQKTIEQVVGEISHHCTQAKKALEGTKIFEHPHYLYEMLEPLERAVAAVQREREKTLQFIQDYQMKAQ